MKKLKDKTKSVGRPSGPSRVQLAPRVLPETVEALNKIKADSKEAYGEIIDRLVKSYAIIVQE